MRWTDRHWHARLWGLAMLCVSPLAACDEEEEPADSHEEEESSSSSGGSSWRRQSTKKETVADCKDECDDVCGECKSDCDEDDDFARWDAERERGDRWSGALPDDLPEEVAGYASDLGQQRPTYSMVWMNPEAYYFKRKYDYAARMEKAFPEGCLVEMIGSVCVGVQGQQDQFCQPYCDPAPGAAASVACATLCPKGAWEYTGYGVCIP